VDMDRWRWADLATSLRLDSFAGGDSSSRIEETRAAVDCSGRDSKALGNGLECGAVVLLGLIGEAKESKEDDGADDGEPASELEGGCHHVVSSPDHRWDLVDARKSHVGVGPALPRPYAPVDVERNGVQTKRDSAKNFDSREAHKPDVSIAGKIVVAGKEFVELRSALVEEFDAQDGVDCGDKPDDDGWAEHKDVGDPTVVGVRPATNVLEDVEAMTLIDII